MSKTLLKQCMEYKLTFMLTGKGTLGMWDRMGVLDRETELYRNLAQYLSGVNLVSYGGKSDDVYRPRLGGVELLASYWSSFSEVNQYLLWQLHKKSLESTSVIKTNQLAGAEIALWIKRKVGCKMIARCGYIWSLNYERQFGAGKTTRKVKAMERRAFEEAEMGVVTTEANMQYVVDVHGISLEKLRVIPNFVNTNRFIPCANRSNVGQLRLVYVGRFSPEKNPRALIEALAILKDRGRELPKLVLIGDGDQREQLQIRASELDLPVDFPGVVNNENLPQKLRRADFYAQPSLYEGHPKALLEAMACGLPCIGTNVEGIRQEISHRENGFLCEPVPESIALAIETLMTDEELRLELGLRAREHVVEKYSLEQILDLELSAIEKVMAI